MFHVCRKKRVTQEDVWELQCQALCGQITHQQETGALQKEKMQLHILLLKRLIASPPEELSATGLLMVYDQLNIFYLLLHV